LATSQQHSNIYDVRKECSRPNLLFVDLTDFKYFSI